MEEKKISNKFPLAELARPSKCPPPNFPDCRKAACGLSTGAGIYWIFFFLPLNSTNVCRYSLVYSVGVTRSVDQLAARLNWRRVPRHHQDIATGPTVM